MKIKELFKSPKKTKETMEKGIEERVRLHRKIQKQKKK